MSEENNISKRREEAMGIFSPVLTLREADDLLARMQNIKAAIYQEKGARRALEENLRAEEFSRLDLYAKQARLDLNKTSEVEKLINSWQVEIQSWPVLKVILAKEVASKEESKLKTYFIQQWEKQIPLRLNLQDDRSLIGGVVVEWEGRVYDRSWREKREELVNAVLRVSED